jgi:hypothetical protein
MKRVEDCEYYINGECNCGAVFKPIPTITENLKCNDNPNCHFRKILKLEKENDAIKNGYGVNCESCTSRVELQNIRDIHNRIVALKENQMVINYEDLQMHGIAFVTIDQMKNYFETAYNARNQQVIDLKNKIAGYEGQTHFYCECGGTIKKEKQAKIAKEFLEEVIQEIETKFRGGNKNGNNIKR